ncbi:MAG: hypothetical protein GFH27_549413n17 [Chloroflexi bacterium AL-W]|nr:hypothetical protein [Chloroflexi bacterium AL-N1]NOK71415.1 hypothetical protein [Chloroflexi bacterium AL-N10]NOK78818.1 hypothetical protein [Chloroflexi bacterium AL-N5]NOK86236.1 hypothetical protein [Chloroflexi bacterium AL-W]NOK93140.1 hypothetical protein [Chloroflexi bacterium AL-N15]
MNTLSSYTAELCRAFDLEQIEVKPQATNKEKTRAMAVLYADMRAYEERLDEVVGVENWSVIYQMSDRGVVCELTICGVTKSGIGDYPRDESDDNPATSAEAQAFKRACSRFGIGRYIYHLPKVWADYDREKKRFQNPERIINTVYAMARIDN